jgi:hypothetical protein
MKRFWILAGAATGTLATLTLAMVLGGMAFNVRSRLMHEARLRKVMHEQPTVERLTKGLQEEGTPLLAAPSNHGDAERAIAQHGGVKVQEIRGKAARYPRLRVFHAADMNYFIFFDADGVMRDFTCVSR